MNDKLNEIKKMIEDNLAEASRLNHQEDQVIRKLNKIREERQNNYEKFHELLNELREIESK